MAEVNVKYLEFAPAGPTSVEASPLTPYQIRDTLGILDPLGFLLEICSDIDPLLVYLVFLVYSS